jgi:hypothetical protein
VEAWRRQIPWTYQQKGSLLWWHQHLLLAILYVTTEKEFQPASQKQSAHNKMATFKKHKNSGKKDQTLTLSFPNSPSPLQSLRITA